MRAHHLIKSCRLRVRIASTTVYELKLTEDEAQRLLQALRGLDVAIQQETGTVPHDGDRLDAVVAALNQTWSV